MKVQPYLNLDGRCEEAIEFYRSAVGAQVEMLLRFKDSPDTSMCAPDSENKIMHARFRIGESVLMASDSRNTGHPVFQGISLSLSVSNDAEAERIFGALSDGGQIQMPLTKTFFTSKFGMLTDRFGVSWMVAVGI